MGCKSIVEQLAEALGKDTVNNTDQIPVVTNNTLYRVKIGDLASSLGLTGSLTSLNSGGATPVLLGTSPNYQIRGISAGTGVSVTVNPQNTVSVAANVKNAGNSDAGQPLIVNSQASQLNFRRLKAGRGINLTTNNNSIIVENAEVAVSSKTIIVNSLNDLPVAVGGVITLADDTIYFFTNDISTANRFVVGVSTVLTSNDPFVTVLTYTGSGAMFTLQNGTQGFKELGISCPNGALFDSSAATTGSLLLRYLLLYQVKDLGTLKHPSVGIYDIFAAQHTGQGFVYDDNVSGARFRTVNVTIENTTNNAAELINLGAATFDELEIDSWQSLNTVAGQTFLTGATNGDNLTAKAIGFVSKCTIKGDMQGLSVIDADSPNWSFSDNNSIADSIPRGQISLNAPTTTSIGTTGLPVVINGVFTEAEASQFETNVNGRVTYKGVKDRYTRLDCTVSLEPVTGSNKRLSLQFVISGADQSVTKIERTISAGDSSVISIDWGFVLSTDDFIELAVTNETDTTNIQVNQALLRCS
jgi:hypothetical protein